MASPQLEKGYTRVANEILQAVMKLKIVNATQLKIILCIWRYTYGFRRKEHEMSNRFIAGECELDRTQVHKELQDLIEKKIIIKVGEGKRKTQILAFNKNYNEWAEAEKEVAAPAPPPPPKKKAKQKYDKDSTYFKAAQYFHSKVKSVAKDAGVEHLIARANLQRWADDMRKILEIDKVDKRLLLAVMDWVVEDDFWKTNILSASKLRKQLPQLIIKMNAEQNKMQGNKKQSVDPRDREIALNQWIADGNDPEEFIYKR